MQNLPSPLDTLRQLKEMLDAGALTPTEFEALKQRLVFSELPTMPSLPPAFEEAAITPPHTPYDESPEPPAAPFSPALEEAANVPVRAENVEPPVAPAALQPNAAPLPPHFEEPVSAWPSQELAEGDVPPARSSPLGLVIAIGAVLAFLAVVVYLSMNRPPSEHISSTSQTAADSLAATIETGPQAAPLPVPAVAEPETVRVAPDHPAPPIPARPAPTVRDSEYVAPAPAAPDSATR